MISRLLVISLLSLGFFTTTTRAIATSSAPEAIASVNQSDLKPDVQPLPMSNVASPPVCLGSASHLPARNSGFRLRGL